MQINSSKNVKITDRILQILENKEITKYKFCKDLGFSNGFLDKPREITTDKYANILEYFPDINPKWLLTGEGATIKTKSTKNLTISKSKKKGKEFDEKQKVQKTLPNTELQPGYGRGIKLIPIEAMAGWGEGDMQVMDYETGDYIVPEFEELNVDYMIRVKGSSMYPKYNSGDLIACKKLFLSDLFFQWNKVYVLSTEQGALVKRIHKGSNDEHIRLISDNPKYEPFEIHLSKVYAIALVIGVIRLE